MKSWGAARNDLHAETEAVILAEDSFKNAQEIARSKDRGGEPFLSVFGFFATLTNAF